MSRKKALNEMRLEFLSDSRNESFARSTVCAFASQLDPTVGELTEIRTAVSEAVTNAIIHGYRGRSGIVKVSASYSEGGVLRVRISDKGCGIADIERAREPLLPSDESGERGGMGFSIMESFTGQNDGKVRSRARNDRHTYQAHRAKRQCRLKHRCVKRKPRPCRSSRSLR